MTAGKVESVASSRTKILLDDDFTLHARFGRGVIYVDAEAGSIQNGTWDYPFETIQDAVDYASDGDVIVIAQGTYRGPGNRDIDCDGMAITIQSQDPNDPDIIDNTIIDCEEQGRAFSLSERESGDVIIQGLTIINGNAEAGGAIYCNDGASLILRDCVIRDCEARYNGGAIICYYGRVRMERCDIEECFASFGGGLYCSQSEVFLRHCQISDNEAYSRGGGIHLGGGCQFEVTGCTLNGNHADDRGGGISCTNNRPDLSTLTQCVLRENYAGGQGGGFYGLNSVLTIQQCLFERNEAIELGGGLYLNPERCSVEVVDCNLVSNYSAEGSGAGFNVLVGRAICLEGENSWVDNDWLATGEGTVVTDSNCTIGLERAVFRIECELSGACTIKVGLNAELNLVDTAHVDLLDTEDPNEMGLISCKGLLRLTDQARLENANIEVARASLEDESVISNCPILAEAGAPYGQFYVESGATISVHEIQAEGDRYLDMDPNGFDFNDIQVDRILVTVQEGVGKHYGGLFECRGLDGLMDIFSESGSYAHQVWEEVPAFDLNSWTIDRMELVEGAKLNLTNRFDFQEPYDQDGAYEVLYVKELILGPNSVLNTAYNQLYYGHLTGDPNQIVNVPLLGYSLNNISFDDHDEYLTRIQHNGFIYNGIQTTIERIEGMAPDPNGVLRMCNQDDSNDDNDEVVTARAKALFAKSGEENLTIRFEYLFENVDPNTELVIYLTDDPELLSTSDRDQSDHYIEVARLSPPPQAPQTRPGAVGSGRWGVFEQLVSRGDLNFFKGTLVEFELLGGEGTCILINNWDPAIYCNPMVCGDVTGDGGVTLMDYLAVISQFGAVAGVPADGDQSTACLDGVFSDDGIVGTDDVASWQWFLRNHEYVGNLCYEKPSLGTCSYCPVTSSESKELNLKRRHDSVSDDYFDTELLLLGKQTNLSKGTLTDKIYGHEVSQGQGVDFSISDANPGAVQLVQNPADPEWVCQVHSESGLIRLPDGAVLLGGRMYPIDDDPRYQGNAMLTVGLQMAGEGEVSGRPLLDAAFDAQGDLYIVPVVVNPEGESAYAAAARLRFNPMASPPDPCIVVQIYDNPPLEDDNQNRNYPRAIEVDAQGNVYVLHSHVLNEAYYLTVFDPDGHLLEIPLGDIDSDLYIPAPSAFCVSQVGPYLYLASGLNAPEALTDKLYVISTESWSLIGTLTLENMGHITSVAEDPKTGDLWVQGFTAGDIPDYLSWDNADFYEGYAVLIPYESHGVFQAQPLSNLGIYEMGLPLSALWLNQP